MWASLGLQAPYNEFFLGYVAPFSLSLFAFVGGVLTTDAGAVRRVLEGRVSTARYGGALLFIAAGPAVLWLADIVPALLAGTTPRPSAVATPAPSRSPAVGRAEPRGASFMPPGRPVR